jgi:hypothetical protein
VDVLEGGARADVLAELRKDLLVQARAPRAKPRATANRPRCAMNVPIQPGFGSGYSARPWGRPFSPT